MKNIIKNQNSEINTIENSNRIVIKGFLTFFAFAVIVLINSNNVSSQNFRIVQSGPSVSNPGDNITYVIAIKNNGNSVSDAVVTTFLPSGNLYTYESSKPIGKYNAKKNTVTWDKTNNSELVSFSNSEIYVTVTIKIGSQVSGEYKVPDMLSKLKSYTTLESVQQKILINSNEINIDVPRLGGAVLPVE